MKLLISEVSKICKVTKKAINYYEQQGLLELKYNDNGYRCFTEYDVTLLKEITVLRQLGMSVSDIKSVITSEDKHKALHAYRLKKEIHLQQVKAQYDYLNYLLESNPTIEEAFNEIEHKLNDHVQIKDKLLQAFPGNYGMYLCMHFGRFLDGKLDTPEKMAAYQRIVEFLDHIASVEFPEDLQLYMAEAFDSLSKIDLQVMEKDMDSAVNDYANFMEENKDRLEQYLEYRNSEDFKASPAYRMQQILLDFQKNNGYYDIFIANLQILSSSYQMYQDKLQAANERFLAEYPQAQQIFIQSEESL
ncbi:MerR family transcriptional regulator [Paenibacillus eucommiae]|uniref:DNA-binding transcriptional MerR regulator n=1 Tax=Paenibacillus eucommiae TaxID=1355755 RepID=A0ABS4J7Z3_9BACL|nr:MerR family transcriptional regulator [Paenibacillus eucommiae]MBP1995365.1 DNA-binding transcriptional MerR regulator [Paenibacillus eucommiae]